MKGLVFSKIENLRKIIAWSTYGGAQFSVRCGEIGGIAYNNVPRLNSG
jgi:hypothetical protein